MRNVGERCLGGGSESGRASVWGSRAGTAPQGMEDFLALGEKAPVWAPSWWSPWALVPKPGATPTYAEAGGLNDHGSPIRAGPRNRSFQQSVPSRECWRAHPVMTQLYKMFLQ